VSLEVACLVLAGLAFGCGDDDDDGSTRAGDAQVLDAGKESGASGHAPTDGGRGTAGRDADGSASSRDSGVGGGGSGGGDAAMDAGGEDASDAQQTTDDAGTTPEQACQQLVDATCDWFHACRSPTGDCATQGPAQIVKTRCTSTPDSVTAGRARLDPDALTTCLDAVRTVSESCSQPPPTLAAAFNSTAPNNPCTKVFVGLGKLGDDCYPQGTYGSDGCGEGFCMTGECPGTCTAFTAIGQECSQPGSRCGPNARCSGDHCRALLQQDDDCSDPLDACATGLYCAHDDVCRRPLAAGEPCTSNEECGSLSCAPEGAGGALVCFVRVPEGQPCRADASCYVDQLCIDGTCAMTVARGERCYSVDNCPAGDRCVRADVDDAQGTCEPKAALSEPCVNDFDCATGLYCSVGGPSPVCVARVGDGMACTAARCLETLWCDPESEQCRPISGEGGPCYREGQLGCGDALLCMGDKKCHPRGANAGDPCSGYFTPSCAVGLACDRATQTCVSLPGIDDACNRGEDVSCMPGSWCACDGMECGAAYDPWTGDPLERCKPRVALGQPCVSYQQCAEGSCNETTSTCQNPPGPCTGL
jgi:hypothetical protein